MIRADTAGRRRWNRTGAVRAALIGWAVAAVANGGCSLSNGEVRVVVSGSESVVHGIDGRGEGGGLRFSDGYTVRFERFVVRLSGLRVARGGGDEVGFELGAPLVYDLKQPGAHRVQLVEGLQTGRWDDLSLTVGVGGSAAAGNVDAHTLGRVEDGGYALLVEGSAREATTVVRFSWGFSGSTRYAECVDGDEESGVWVPAGGEAVARFFFAGERLFHDDLDGRSARLRFAPIAKADTDSDGEVTLAELRRIQLAKLAGDRYRTGARGIENLADYLAALAGSLVRFQFEGSCTATRL